MEGIPPIENNIEKEAIKKLEETKWIDLESKEIILATYSDLKPLSEIVFKGGPGSDAQENISDLLNVLSDLGFKYAVDPAFEIKPDSVHYLISKSLELIEEYKNMMLNENISEVEWDKERGRMFGFPKTAVNHLDGPELVDMLNLPEGISSDERKFLFFRPSRNGWQKEMEWVRKIMDAVQTISPTIYKQIINKKSGW